MKKIVRLTEGQLYDLVEEVLKEYSEIGGPGNFNIGILDTPDMEIVGNKEFSSNDIVKIIYTNYDVALRALIDRCFHMFKQGYNYEMADKAIQKTFQFKNLVKPIYMNLGQSGIKCTETLNKCYQAVRKLIVDGAQRKYNEYLQQRKYRKMGIR